MRKSGLVVLSLSFVAIVAATALVQAQPTRRPGGPPAAGETLSFEQNMKGMGRALRGVKRATRDLSAPDSVKAALTSLQTFQERALGAKATFDEVPMSEHAMREYGEDTEAYHNGFRKHLIEAIEASLELERAIMKKDTDAISKWLDEIEEVEHHSHDEFQSEH